MRPSRDEAPVTWKVYDYIVAELRAGRRFPSDAAIAWHMGRKTTAIANDSLLRLCSWGLLVRNRREVPAKYVGRKYFYELLELPGPTDSFACANLSPGLHQAG